VREQLKEVLTQLRVGQLIAALHMGNLSEEQGKKNTHLFATEVMPYLKDVWSDWDDLWTPQGRIEAAAKAAANGNRNGHAANGTAPGSAAIAAGAVGAS
jgi:hypothetical protein